MWIAWFLATWAAFVALLILITIREDKEETKLLVQINRDLKDTLAVYPHESSSTGVETKKALSKVG
jgi:hypothetical protein